MLDLFRAACIALTQKLEGNHLRRQLDCGVAQATDLHDQLRNELPFRVVCWLDHAEQRLQILKTVDGAPGVKSEPSPTKQSAL